ncbi:MAG: hypothetical protein FJW83_02010 [Actinobacteria bacterium]|nr:hypothetical protein [Actinomycetota bacterium]
MVQWPWAGGPDGDVRRRPVASAAQPRDRTRQRRSCRRPPDGRWGGAPHRGAAPPGPSAPRSRARGPGRRRSGCGRAVPARCGRPPQRRPHGRPLGGDLLPGLTGRAQRPFQFGGRFSLKAFGPSM